MNEPERSKSTGAMSTHRTLDGGGLGIDDSDSCKSPEMICSIYNYLNLFKISINKQWSELIKSSVSLLGDDNYSLFIAGFTLINGEVTDYTFRRSDKQLESIIEKLFVCDGTKGFSYISRESELRKELILNNRCLIPELNSIVLQYLLNREGIDI